MSGVLPAHGAWMQTHSGSAFDYLAPQADQIKIGDVAHALARINRFCGHLQQPVNVAQHSLIVLALVRAGGTVNALIQLQALTHDAPEAFVQDLPAPLKRLLPDYKVIEARVWAACAFKFGVPTELHPQIKEADFDACRLEAWRGFQADPLGGWAGRNPLPDAPLAAIELLSADHTPAEWTRRWLGEYYHLSDRAGSGK